MLAKQKKAPTLRDIFLKRKKKFENWKSPLQMESAFFTKAHLYLALAFLNSFTSPNLLNPMSSASVYSGSNKERWPWKIKTLLILPTSFKNSKWKHILNSVFHQTTSEISQKISNCSSIQQKSCNQRKWNYRKGSIKVFLLHSLALISDRTYRALT